MLFLIPNQQYHSIDRMEDGQFHENFKDMKQCIKWIHLNRCVSLLPGWNNMLLWHCDKDRPLLDRGYQAGVRVTVDKACLSCPPSEYIEEFLIVRSWQNINNNVSCSICMTTYKCRERASTLWTVVCCSKFTLHQRTHFVTVAFKTYHLFTSIDGLYLYQFTKGNGIQWSVDLTRELSCWNMPWK